MNSKRVHLLLLVSIGVLFLALLGGAYGTNNLLAARAQQLTAAKAKSMALSQQQLSLKKAQKEIKQYANLQKITQSVVPEDKNQAAAVREIVNIAGANNIALAAITFPASTLGTAPGGGATTVAPTPSALNNPKTTALSQLQPVKNIPGVYSLLITIQSDPEQPVPYAKFISFLDALEHNRRTAQVATISLQPKVENRNLLTFTLSVSEYIKP